MSETNVRAGFMKLIALLLLLLSASCLPSKNKPAALNTDCYFPGLVESRPSMYKDCGVISFKGDISLKKEVIAKIKFDSDGLANGHFATQGCFWLHKNGLMRKSVCVGPYADDFHDGLTRYTNKDGKYGYMDKQLNIVIGAEYDWGASFNYKHARVCNGCKSFKHEGSEHSIMKGGQWKVIDMKGEVANTCPGPENNRNCKIPSY